MLTAKGYEVAFRKRSKGKANGRIIRPPKSFALAHDPSGSDWPRCGLLVLPFRRLGDDVSYKPAEEYFGYDPQGGACRVPPKDLKHWHFVSEIDGIDYWRPGIDYEGDYEHYFKARGHLFGPKEKPLLFRIGKVYRLELGSGCVVNWRGIVTP